MRAEWACLPHDPYYGEIFTVEAKGKKYRFSVIGTTESGCQHGSADSNTMSKWFAPPCVSERPFMSEVEWVDRSQT